MKLLEGKTVLITGGSRGIGKGIVKVLIENGANVAFTYASSSGPALELSEKLNSNETKCISYKSDASIFSDCEKLIENVMNDFGNIDALINNAGMQFRTALEDFPRDKFEELLKTNVSSVFNVSQVVAKYMIKRGEGKIINIASVQTSLARPGIAPYTATKGAVGNITKGMATDWAKYGIQCNAIAPGYFDTPLNAALVSDSDFTAWLKKRTPAGRWGEVHELVGASIFLSSAASNFVNGHTLYVDGGITASL